MQERILTCRGRRVWEGVVNWGRGVGDGEGVWVVI